MRRLVATRPVVTGLCALLVAGCGGGLAERREVWQERRGPAAPLTGEPAPSGEPVPTVGPDALSEPDVADLERQLDALEQDLDDVESLLDEAVLGPRAPTTVGQSSALGAFLGPMGRV